MMATPISKGHEPGRDEGFRDGALQLALYRLRQSRHAMGKRIVGAWAEVSESGAPFLRN
jgi:hypothetical protein